MGRMVFLSDLQVWTLSCKFCSRSFSDFNRYHDHTRRHKNWYLKHWLSNKHRTLKNPNKLKKRNDLLQDQTRRKQQWFLYTDGRVKIRSVFVGDQEEGESSLFACKVCNRAFSAAIHLIRHERQAHNRETSADGNAASMIDKKRFRCKFCGRTHHNKSDLDYHERSHTGETIIYTCDVCKSTFKRKVYLNRHMRIHNDIRPYVCKVCGKSFVKGGGLKEHERTHTGEKPYKCPTCHRGFSGRANLRRHEMTHSGEQPFECKICNKRCNRIASLRQHMRIHTGERPYNCMHCNKAFPTCANLRRHERTHLEKKQFQCLQCGKEFTQKYTLKLHEMNHLGIRPHLCLLCGKTFMEKRKLRQHLSLAHGVVQEPEDSQDASISERYGLDLALEGNKSIQLADGNKAIHLADENKAIHLADAIRPNAISDLEGAHFKTMEDFQAYWKAAYLESDPLSPEPVISGMPESDLSGHMVKPVESASKLQTILSKLSHNVNMQNPQNHITELPKQDLHYITEKQSPGSSELKESNDGIKGDWPSDSFVHMTKDDASIRSYIGAKQDTSTNVDGQNKLQIPQVQMKISNENNNGALNLTIPKVRDGRTSDCAPAAQKQTTADFGINNKNKSTSSSATQNAAESGQKTPSQRTLTDEDGEHDSSGTEEYSYESDKETESISLSKVQSNHHQSHPRVEPSKQAPSQNGNSIFNRFNMPGAYRCDLCCQTFTSEIVLEIHMRTHKQAQHQSYCIQCNKAFSNILDLEEHIKAHNNEILKSSMNSSGVSPALKSPDYSGNSSAIPRTEESMTSASPEKKPKKKGSGKKRVYTCQECGKEYKKSVSLKHHMKTHAIGIVPVECVANVDNMRTYSNVDIHRSLSEENNGAIPKTVQQFLDSSGRNSEPSDITKNKVKCATCFEEFNNRELLAKHMEKHNEPLVISCSDTMDESNVDSNTENPWGCSICSASFPKQEHLAEHINKHRKSKTSELNAECSVEFAWACSICDKRFSKQERLAGHMNKHKTGELDDEEDTEKQYKCSVCDRSFSKQEKLAGHMNKHKEYNVKVATLKEAVQQMEQVNCKDKQKRWKCPYCEKMLVKRSQLVEHLHDHIGVEPYTCKVCHKGFSKKANYVSHQITHTNELKYECDTCHKKFKHSQSLKKHLIKCKKIYTCDRCNSEFRHKRSLNSHVWNMHIRVENCRCKICGKVMSSASGLREHEMTHNGEKPYKCDICARGFANRSNLRRHVMIHDNDRPFVCNFCKMTFNRLASLQQHERCHTGEKPYGCSYCGLFFTSKSTRRKHEKRHTKQKDIPCKFCDKVFWDRYSCRMHERIHIGDLPYECSLCTKKFPERNVLSRHMKSAHKEWYLVNMDDCPDSDSGDEEGEDMLDSSEDQRLQPLSESEDDDMYHMSSDTDEEVDDEVSRDMDDIDDVQEKDIENLDELSGADEDFQGRLDTSKDDSFVDVAKETEGVGDS